MPRYRLLIEYDGAPYSGWQRQDDRASVQGAVEAAFRALGEETIVQGAGRTDAGVHATGQVAHTDTTRDWKPFELWSALNHHLREETVAIIGLERVDPEFHARFSATHRAYEYRMICRRPPLALERGRAWNVKVPLDVDRMNEAARRLVGEHDFTTFRSTECQAKSPVKTLDVLRATEETDRGGQCITWRVEARSFLHNQVRSLVGSLEWVGRAKWTAHDLEGALRARDRAACGPVAPAHGLYLCRVDYGS